MQALVCIGTTDFDDLIKILDCSAFQKMLEDYGFTKLIF